MKLTPQILRDAADLLVPSAGPREWQWYEFMCHCVEDASNQKTSDEFAQLLIEHGVIDRPFAAMSFVGQSSEERQAVRFMFLEFLALAMEDGAL